MIKKITTAVSTAAFLSALSMPQYAIAIPFIIDPTKSSLTLSGSVSATGVGATGYSKLGDVSVAISTSTETLQSQLPLDSRTTSIYGSIEAELIGSEIVFNEGSIIPNINGDYAPGEVEGESSAPSQVAGFIEPMTYDLDVSGSNFVIDIISKALVKYFKNFFDNQINHQLFPSGSYDMALRSSEFSIAGSAPLSSSGEFSTNPLTGQFLSGEVSSLFLSESLPGEPFPLPAGDGTYTEGALIDEIFLPFEFFYNVSIPASTFADEYSVLCVQEVPLFGGCAVKMDLTALSGTIDFQFGLDAQIFATYEKSPVNVPEPSTFGLFGMGLLSVWMSRSKSRKS